MTIRSERLQKQLDKINIGEAFGVQFDGAENANTFCPFHEDVDSSTSKSASVSAEGLFDCKGCSASGDAFDFYACRKGTTRAQAIKALTDQAKAKTKTQKAVVAPKKVARRNAKRTLEAGMEVLCQTILHDRGDFLDYLRRERGLLDSTIEHYKLGCDERRITIPIYDNEGNLVNLRRYLPHAKSAPKMVSFAPGYGKARMFPIEVLQSTPVTEPLVLCEGEWDAILLNQEGIPTVCITAGVSTWDSAFTGALADREVVIIYDVHDKDNLGQRIAWERARTLRACGASVRIVVLPLPDSYRGGDVTNYLVDEGRSGNELRGLIAEAPAFDIPPSAEDGPDAALSHHGDTAVYPVTLAKASKAEYFYKRILITAIVAGKGVAPYMPPRHISVEVAGDDGSSQTIDKIFDPWDGAILSLIQCSEQRLRSFVKAIMGISSGEIAKISVLDTFNIEEIFLIPSVDPANDQGPYVMRKAYYVGHGLQTNRVYKLEGYTLPDPRNQSATHVFTKASPAETDIETFALTPEDHTTLAELFQTDDLEEKFNDIAEQMAEHVTRIYGRTTLHTAVDLVFHSTMSFWFDDTLVRKGWLDVLIVGDTRTGKGFVTEGLCRHYNVGEVVSGENVTLAGLVGGVQRIGDRWTLVWGKIPLADRRLIIIDEAGALSQHDIGRMSRIRSEGVAELTKIISERTTSRTRLLWLANPRPPGEQKQRMVADYTYGIESVPELAGAAEDVARFDFALIVAHNEVANSIINRRHRVTTTLRYTKELCHKLVMWAWSRQPDEIDFTAEATSRIMVMSQTIAKQFTPKITLIQAEDVRFKLARIALAAAARTYSTPDGTHLVVNADHVDFAYNFLHHIYSRPTSGYDRLSAVERERSTIRDPDNVKHILQQAGELLPDLLDGLLEHKQITARDLCDYAGMDPFQARTIISELVRARAIIKNYGWYVKKPAFGAFLQRLKADTAVDNITPPETNDE